MKKFLILFKAGSIPFSSRVQDAYIREWQKYINGLMDSKKLKSCYFLKKDGVIISKKIIESKSYIPHKDILSGFMIIEADSLKEVINISKSCPVFKRGGGIQIKEIDKEYLTENNITANEK